MIDCISRGRLDAGFVRGVPYEIFAANTNPTQTVERLWEGVDLVVKAWTTHDGPFNFEGRFTHRRAINIWPRPYQTPHPPIWITGSSDFEAIRKVASRGYVFATFLQPYDKVREMFDAYRSAYRRQRPAGRRRDRLHAAGLYRGYRSRRRSRGPRTAWYLTRQDRAAVPQPARLCAGRAEREGAAGHVQRAHRAIRAQTLEFQKEQGVVIYGTPDFVADRSSVSTNASAGSTTC